MPLTSEAPVARTMSDFSSDCVSARDKTKVTPLDIFSLADLAPAKYWHAVDGGVVDWPTATAETNPTLPLHDLLAITLLSETLLWDLDLDLVADVLSRVPAVLSRVPEVDAIYVHHAAGETHVWTIVRDFSDGTLNAVFDRELELYDCLGNRLSAVEFHVLTHEDADHLGTEWREIFKREH